MKLEWPGQKAYNEAPTERLNMIADDQEIGQVKSSGNLTFIRVYGAGHMVPLDQPEASLDFFNRWIYGEWSKH